MAVEVVVVAVAVIAAYLLYRFRTDSTESLFQTIQTLRTVIFGAVGIIIALFLISSGYLPYMIVGAIFIAVGVWWVLYEEPHEKALEVIR